MHSLLAITTPFTMFSHYYTPFELAHAIRLSKATRIFVQPQFLSLATKAAKDAGFPDDHIYIFEGQVEGRRSFGEMIRQVRKDFVSRIAVRPAGKDTLAYLIFSSGTGGLPKGQCNVLAILSCSWEMFSCHDITLEPILLIVPTSSHGKGNTQSPHSKHISRVLPRFNTFVPPQPPTSYPTFEGFPVSLAFLPMHHTFGLNVYCFRAFLYQATSVLLPQWDVDFVLELIPKSVQITSQCYPRNPKLAHPLFSFLHWY